MVSGYEQTTNIISSFNNKETHYFTFLALKDKKRQVLDKDWISHSVTKYNNI